MSTTSTTEATDQGAQRARVWLWLQHLARTDADRHQYAWPSTPETQAECGAALDAADRFAAKADEVAGGTITDHQWREAMDAFHTAPKGRDE